MPSFVAEPLRAKPEQWNSSGMKLADDDVLHVHPRAVGDALHLLEEPLGDVLLLLVAAIPAIDPLGIEQLDAADLDLQLLGLDVEQEADVLADVVAEQGPLLVAHLVGRPLDVEHPVAVDLFEEPRAAAGDGLRLGLGRDGPERPQGQPDRSDRRSTHRRVSRKKFEFLEPFRRFYLRTRRVPLPGWGRTGFAQSPGLSHFSNQANRFFVLRRGDRMPRTAGHRDADVSPPRHCSEKPH